MYRVLVSIPLSQNPLFRSNAQTIASMSGAVLNLILIMVLGQVYQRLAVILNDWGEKSSKRHVGAKKALTTSQRLQMSFVEIGDEHIFKLKIQKDTWSYLLSRWQWIAL